MSRRNLGFLIFISAALVGGCDSLSTCNVYYGHRFLRGERAENGPNRLVQACVYGSEHVARIVYHRGTAEDECAKKYQVTARADSNVTDEVSNTLEELDACVAGTKGTIQSVIFSEEDTDHLIHKKGSAQAIAYCESLRGKNGVNPNLPCY